MAGRDDDATPPAKRRSSTALSVWATVAMWLGGNEWRRVMHRADPAGHWIGACDGVSDAVRWELVRPDEDPSAAALRAISALSSR